MDSTKCSNALVSTVDFYASALAEARAELEQKDAVIRQLGEQLKRASSPVGTANDIARDGVIGAAFLLVDGFPKSGWRAKLNGLKDAIAALRTRNR